MSKKRDSLTKAPGISRRDFARRAAVTAAAMAALPSELLPAPAASAALPAFLSLDEPKLSAESQAEVDEKIEAIFRKYGSWLSDDQKKDIRRLVTEGQKPLDTLRTYKLDNSDQPATVLKLYPDSPSAQQASSRAGAAHPARKE